MIPSSPPEGLGAKPGVRRLIPSSTGLMLAGLIGITLAFYHGLWLPGLVLIKGEAFRFHLPIKQYLIERLGASELPQWFPYEALGRAFIGSAHTGVFHPFTALYFFFSVPDAYRIATLLSCLLAALGSFALGRTMGFSYAGALVAGISFALSGYVVSLTEHITYLYAICALPIFCVTLEKALSQDQPWVVASSAVWTTVFLIGDLQTGYYYGFIALLWTMMRAPCPRPNACLRLTLTIALTVLLAGIQLGPSWAVYIHSLRAQPELFHEQALFGSTQPLRLVTLLAAPIAQNAEPTIVARLFFGYPGGSGWGESLYLGIPMIGLALIGTWYRRDLRMLAWLGVLTFLLSLGRWGGLYEVFYHVVPLWSAFRTPEKLMGVVSFTVAMLAGAGFDELRARQTPLIPWLAAAILFTATGLGLRTEAAVAWAATNFEAPMDLAREVVDSAGLAFLFSAAAALGIWLIVAGTRKQLLRNTLTLSLLMILITLDLSRANFGAYHIGPVEAATFTPQLATALRAREGVFEPGRFRLVTIVRYVFVTPLQIRSLLGPPGAESVEQRQALDLEHNAGFHLETLRPLLPGHSPSFAAMFLSTMAQRVDVRVAARFNVAYYIGRQHHFKDRRFVRMLVTELPEYDLALVRNPIPAKPRAYLSRRPERAASPVDPAALLARPDFLSGEVDVIETPDATLPGLALSGSAVIDRYAPEEVRVRVETPQPAVLILVDAFEKGWTAMLESGLELPVMRANALVRAVMVPAGTHLVTFSYETPLLKAGAWASLAGVLLSIGFLAYARCRMRPAGMRL